MSSNFSFLIQTINGKIKHDFSFELINSISWLDWYNRTENSFNVIESEINQIKKYKHFQQIVPVGTVEFVHEYFRIHGIPIPKPINIPSQLTEDKYTKRNIIREVNKDNLIAGLFTKSAETVKGFTGIYTGNIDIADNIFFQSDIVDIESEYRCFVHQKQLKGIQFYLGDFTVFPDVKIILDMIAAYTDSPPSYTLDIGVSDKLGTFIIEAHNFYSCGLYGFRDYSIIPYMFIKWYLFYLGLIK